MKIEKFDNEEAWLEGRMGRVTGTRLKDLIVKRGTKPKKGFWEIIAERVAIPHDGENVMDRGKRLEDEAVERFTKETGKKVNTELVIWSREDNSSIALSPDGVIGKTTAVEVKCLNSAAHIEAWVTKEIPAEYEYQGLQYFIVNDSLKTLYFIFYDPRLPRHDYFTIEIKREAIQDKITECLELERESLARIEEIEKEFTF